MNQDSSDWSGAHTTHAVHDFAFHTAPSLVQAKTHAWHEIQESMPQGALIKGNSFFESHKSDQIYLVHGTSNLDAILASGALYASAGCLVGSIYCAQAFPEEGRLRLHNLGDYVFNREVPSILSAHNVKRDSSLLLIELQLPQNTNPLRAGIDYLRMGHIHYRLYRSLQYLLTHEERTQIERNVTNTIQRTLDFLAYSNHLFLEETSLTLVQARDYITRLNAAASDLYMLGYLYFEAVSEYLMLASTDALTLQMASRKEFNNWLYKELMYGLYENLRGNFNISCFNPSPNMLRDYVHTMNQAGKLSVDYNNMIRYVAERVTYWVNTRFFTHPGTAVDWLGSTARFEDLATSLSPLIGHSIHRQLRTQTRYKEFYFYFDHIKALEIWNYWNKANIAVPFNGVFPKGEIGINPAYTDMKYRIYKALTDAHEQQYIRKGEEMPIQIAPRLIDLHHSFMRAGGHYAFSKRKESADA